MCSGFLWWITIILGKESFVQCTFWSWIFFFPDKYQSTNIIVHHCIMNTFLCRSCYNLQEELHCILPFNMKMCYVGGCFKNFRKTLFSTRNSPHFNLFWCYWYCEWSQISILSTVFEMDCETVWNAVKCSIEFQRCQIYPVWPNLSFDIGIPNDCLDRLGLLRNVFLLIW